MLPDCLPWLGVLGEWTNPLWLGVCKRLSQHLQWTQCHIERLCIRDYCRTQHFDWPDLWNMSGKIAVGGGIPKAIPSRSMALRRTLPLWGIAVRETNMRRHGKHQMRVLCGDPSNGHIKIDLNHDGTRDFDIQAAASGVYCGTGSGGVHAVVTVTPNTGDGVVASGGNAAALASGIRVGPGVAFYKSQALMTNSLLSRGCGSYRYGNWCSGYAYACSRTAYLGLEFLVNGQIHYGWAYVSVSASIFNGLSVTLKGYAYETIAGH